MDGLSQGEAVAALQANEDEVTIEVQHLRAGDEVHPLFLSLSRSMCVVIVADVFLQEILEIEFAKGSNGLGFSIAGGIDDPNGPEDPSIYIVQVCNIMQEHACAF